MGIWQKQIKLLSRKIHTYHRSPHYFNRFRLTELKIQNCKTLKKQAIVSESQYEQQTEFKMWYSISGSFCFLFSFFFFYFLKTFLKNVSRSRVKTNLSWKSQREMLDGNPRAHQKRA